MQITSGKFEADLFVMTNATKFSQNAAYEVPVTETLTPDASNLVELAHTPIAGTVSINGLEETSDTVTTGKFKVSTTTVSEVTTTTIEFFAGDIADTVTISYFYSDEAEEAKIDNRSSAVGEAINYHCGLAA